MRGQLSKQKIQQIQKMKQAEYTSFLQSFFNSDTLQSIGSAIQSIRNGGHVPKHYNNFKGSQNTKEDSYFEKPTVLNEFFKLTFRPQCMGIAHDKQQVNACRMVIQTYYSCNISGFRGKVKKSFTGIRWIFLCTKCYECKECKEGKQPKDCSKKEKKLWILATAFPISAIG